MPGLDAVNILVTKDGIKFATNGDIGKGEIMVRHDPSTDKVSMGARSIQSKETTVQIEAYLLGKAYLGACMLMRLSFGKICHLTSY